MVLNPPPLTTTNPQTIEPSRAYAKQVNHASTQSLGMTVFIFILYLFYCIINNNKVTYIEMVGFFLFINLVIYLLGNA